MKKQEKKYLALKFREEQGKQIHSKKRSRLEHQRLQDLVLYKMTNHLRKDLICHDVTDPMVLNNVDKNNDWLLEEMIDNEEGAEDELIFDDLTQGVEAATSGEGEPITYTRQHTSKEEEEEEIYKKSESEEEEEIYKSSEKEYPLKRPSPSRHCGKDILARIVPEDRKCAAIFSRSFIFLSLSSSALISSAPSSFGPSSKPDNLISFAYSLKVLRSNVLHLIEESKTSEEIANEKESAHRRRDRGIPEELGTYRGDRLAPIDDTLCEFLHRKLLETSSRVRRVLCCLVLRSVPPLRCLVVEILEPERLGFCRERIESLEWKGFKGFLLTSQLSKSNINSNLWDWDGSPYN
ncbi:hypothetical protein CR513_07666, partial [Mucuna pruriens]